MPPLNPLSKSCVALAVSQLLLIPSVTHAATIPVNSNADNNGAGCTLREAIVSANTTTNQNNGCLVGSNSGTDTITFLNGLPSAITLTQGELVVGAGKDIEIDASNISGGVTIDASASFTRVIAITSATLVLDSLTITGGEQSGNGGGIYANESTLTLNNSTVSGNSAFRRGGGIFASNSTLNLYDSVIDNNRTTGGEYSGANGGGIYIGGKGGEGVSSLVLTNTVISNNSTFGSGGGINASYIASVALNNSTVSDNTASGYYSRGGGVLLHNVNAAINSTTISGNSSSYGGGFAASYGNSNVTINNSTINANSVSNQAQGGGIGAFGSGVSVTLNNSTVSGNSSSIRSGGIHSYNADLTLNNVTVLGNLGVEDSIRGTGIFSSGRGDRLTINNSIIANSQAGADCSNTGTTQNDLTIDSASIIGDGSCGANRSGDPGLLDLADNGGSTQTHALSADSIARNSSTGTCLVTDQLGKTRNISDGFCDVGAVEFDASLVNDTTTFVIPLPNGKTVIFDL